MSFFNLKDIAQGWKDGLSVKFFLFKFFFFACLFLLQSHYVEQHALKFTGNNLPLSLKCWD